MAGSLQEQLLKAGLVDQKKVKQLKSEQRKQKKQGKSGQPDASQAEASARAERLKTEAEAKAAKARDANARREAARVRKEKEAQVRQIIEANVISRDGGEQAWQFAWKGKVKKVYVTTEQADKLSRGRLGLCFFRGKYWLLPPEACARIEQRLPDLIVKSNADKASEEEAAYAGFEIPDDLTW